MRGLFSRHKRKFVAVGSALGTAAFMYAIWNSFLALVITLIVVLHELGHYITAAASGAEVGYVIFIPIIVGIIGMTQVKSQPEGAARKIAIAGPIAGLIGSVLVLLAIMLLGAWGYFVPAMMIVAYELLNLFVGADAKRFRQGKVKIA